MKKKGIHSLIFPKKEQRKEGRSVYESNDLPSEEMNQLLKGKNVLITGAGGTIGKSIAIEMVRQGANIYYTDSDESKVKALGQKLDSFSEGASGFVGDITSKGDIKSLCDWLKKKKTVIDTLVNNVGIKLETSSILNTNYENMSQTLDTNFIGPIYLTRLIVENMFSEGIQGAIIFISSIHQWSISKSISYSASKAAVGTAVRELALELAPHGIRVNGIAPGWVAQDPKGRILPFPKGPLHKKSIHPQYIGRAVVYLASNYYSEFTTGATITIDGGLSLPNYLTNSRV
jgi:NAD(P)-dependent dehydrogenase (short-subunit alcohol dehydrogenase family)